MAHHLSSMNSAPLRGTKFTAGDRRRHAEGAQAGLMTIHGMDADV